MSIVGVRTAIGGVERSGTRKMVYLLQGTSIFLVELLSDL